jgi:hypothetical protein
MDEARMVNDALVRSRFSKLNLNFESTMDASAMHALVRYFAAIA